MCLNSVKMFVLQLNRNRKYYIISCSIHPSLLCRCMKCCWFSFLLFMQISEINKKVIYYLGECEVCFCAGSWSLPSVSESTNLFVSGCIHKSSDSDITISAENSTAQMMYICQFSGIVFSI